MAPTQSVKLSSNCVASRVELKSFSDGSTESQVLLRTLTVPGILQVFLDYILILTEVSRPCSTSLQSGAGQQLTSNMQPSYVTAYIWLYIIGSPAGSNCSIFWITPCIQNKVVRYSYVCCFAKLSWSSKYPGSQASARPRILIWTHETIPSRTWHL